MKVETRTLWQDLIVGNPMLIEIQRFRRRYFSFSGNSATSAVLALAVLCYVGLILAVMSGRGEIPPISLVLFQTGVLTLLAPSMMYGAIAGERERRSWDLLLVAPITKAQVVVGKFLGAVAAVGFAALLFLFPILVAGVTYRKTNWHDLFLTEVVSVTFTICVCAMTLLLSARVKRSLMALGASLGTLAVVLIVGPLLLSALVPTASGELEILFFLHPFIALVMVMTHSDRDPFSSTTNPVPASLWGYPQAVVYVGLALVFVAWAANTLVFAENDVRFLPKAKNDA